MAKRTTLQVFGNAKGIPATYEDFLGPRSSILTSYITTEVEPRLISEENKIKLSNPIFVDEWPKPSTVNFSLMAFSIPEHYKHDMHEKY